MADLASCYFCGVALDEPLAEQAVVPAELRGPDADPPTVALCPSCEEKLARITDAIVDAADGGTAADTASSAGDDGPDPLDAADDLVDPTTGGSASPEGTNEAAEAEDGRAGAGVESGEPTAGGGSDEAVAEPADAGSADAEPDDEAVTEEETDAGPADEEARPADAASSEDAAGTDDPSGTDDAGDPTERTVVEGDHSISALEYNKVMRLLQNREFPVDRQEIVTVAASAYQVSRRDCDRVIDVAIDRGLIDEADGQLVRPEQG